MGLGDVLGVVDGEVLGVVEVLPDALGEPPLVADAREGGRTDVAPEFTGGMCAGPVDRTPDVDGPDVREPPAEFGAPPDTLTVGAGDGCGPWCCRTCTAA